MARKVGKKHPIVSLLQILEFLEEDKMAETSTMDEEKICFLESGLVLQSLKRAW
jgi:hypothetical protein